MICHLNLLFVSSILADDSIAFFENKIRPILVEHCYECHSSHSTELQGGLRLDTREGARQGGDSGPAVVAGKTEQSLLLAAVLHEGLQMPPDRKLPDSAIEDLHLWIQNGAIDPRDGPATLESSSLDLEKASQYWAFQPVRMPALPTVTNEAWANNAIDLFVLSMLERKGLNPALAANKVDLCRRVYFDLHGLPPTPEQVHTFVRDESPDAYERLVDELLASRRFGERWGLLWLVVVRFGDT